MNLNLAPEEQQFRDELRAWLKANVPPEWEQRKEESMEERFEFTQQWQGKLFAAGWAGVSWPKEYGGRGANLMQQVIYWQELARASAPPMANELGLGLIGPAIIAFGTEEQKKRYLAKILSAKEIWCQGFSEPDAGSDLANIKTEARLEGDHYIVNGQKVWTSMGNWSHWCELVVRTDKDAQKHKGLSVLLVDMKSPGIEARPLRMMNGECEFCEVFFTNVRVPVENLLGKANDGWKVALGTLMHERATLCVLFQIVFRRNIERLIELSRVIQRNGRPAAEDPIIRQKVAQCYAEVEIMRHNQMRSFSQMSATGEPGPEGSIQKLFWTELSQRLQQTAQELLGPLGQLDAGDDHAIDKGMWIREYMRSKGHTIEAGTSEIQRSIIGHFVLGLPKSY